MRPKSRAPGTRARIPSRCIKPGAELSFVHPHTVCVELTFTSHKLWLCEGSCQISQSWKATIEHKMCQQKGNKREEARSRYEGSNQKEEAIALLVGIPFHGEVWSELWREGRRGGRLNGWVRAGRLSEKCGRLAMCC